MPLRGTFPYGPSNSPLGHILVANFNTFFGGDGRKITHGNATLRERVGDHHGWVYRMQPEDGAARVVNELIVASVCVINIQAQIRGLWKGGILLRRKSSKRVNTTV